MTELWTVLVPILLADIVNPVLFAFLVFAAGSSRPVLNSTSLLLGHTTAYFLAGIVLAIGIEQLEYRIANPEPIDFVFELFIGLLVLWIAFKSRGSENKKPEENKGGLTVVTAFFLGMIVNFVGIPFAIPYFAAISQILKADVTVAQSWYILLMYNACYALPFASVPIIRLITGVRSQKLFEKINYYLDKGSSFLMPIMLVLLGLAMLADVIKYYLTGEALF